MLLGTKLLGTKLLALCGFKEFFVTCAFSYCGRSESMWVGCQHHSLVVPGRSPSPHLIKHKPVHVW